MQINVKPLRLLLSLTLAASLGWAWKTWHRPAWDPDAGYIPAWTEGASVSATSSPAELFKVLDGDLGTAWQSGSPMPTGFLLRKDLNRCLDKPQVECSACSDIQRAFDGDLNTAMAVRQGFSYMFEAGQRPQTVFLKAQTNTDLELMAVEEGGQTRLLGTISPADNFQLKRFDLPHLLCKQLVVKGNAPFAVFELAATAGPPVESVVVDLGAEKTVGQVHTKHWAGEGTATKVELSLSLDGQAWQPVAQLDPSALHLVVTNIAPAAKARYLKLDYTLVEQDWNKVFLWEVKAYDAFGPYGERPEAERGHVKIRDLLGVNGYWSWGTDQYSDQLAPDGGPYRFSPVASHARNYHNMTWDLPTPQAAIDFDQMAKGTGTPAKAWLNWDREYLAWNQAGLNVQASLQFYQFKPEDWKRPREEAHRYAQAFTSHFGPKNGNGQICSIEAGNEPWSYPAEVYREILLGMAQGAAAGDPAVEVFPCALQAVDPTAETQGIFKNYIGARITEEAAQLLDGINVHCYSYAAGANGQRAGVMPEHVNSSFWEILNAIRWRNQNMPGKKIYLSEWGWDSGGGGEDCTHSECVSERAAAAYAVRGAMIAARLGIDRATWFYYGNDKSPSSLYTRSGLVASGLAGFQQKGPFAALQNLVGLVGDKYFLQVVQEDENAWLYLLGDADGTPTHLVAWRPVPGDEPGETLVPWKTKLTIGSMKPLLTTVSPNAPGAFQRGKDGWQVRVGACPVVFVL